VAPVNIVLKPAKMTGKTSKITGEFRALI